ncbi:type II secretion system F family protein [Novosphingobium flavum]|uniref:Type II secretion system F family protein n=1 Tax=Novosphingobium flavum TaxID=1778672 RepID=A0A7X1FSQ2_9SPHN|nr:type II secretion system F family protein [Novosphingobium flavum]MBC2666289.1 type II secretion system F family protein [Novosphingobium flavum]
MVEVIASTPLARALILLLLFALIVGGSLVVFAAANRRSLVRGELRSIGAATDLGSGESLRARRIDAWTRVANQIERMGLNLKDTKNDLLRQKLLAAGYDSPGAPRIYTLIRLVLVITLPCLFVFLSIGTGKPISFMKLYVVGSILALLGLYIPALFVRAKADRRREALVNGFPDCLDLMLICVESGLGLEAALDRVGMEMVLAHAEVAKLLTTATLRLRAGSSREDALRRMADDAGIDEIRSFSTLLIQSDKLGTSIGTTLRIYANEMRERRRMRAEEKAHRLPVLISIPLVTCMLPTMIGVLMLPAAIRVVRQLVPALSGG